MSVIHSRPGPTAANVRADSPSLQRGLELNERSLIFAHPLAAATFGFGIFLVAWIFPPRLYTDLVGDDCHTFLDPAVMSFNLSCLAAVVAGMYVGSSGTIFRTTVPRTKIPIFLRCPITIQSLMFTLILVNVIALLLFVRRFGLAAVNAVLQGSRSYLYELNMSAGEVTEEPWKVLLFVGAVTIPATWHFARSYGRFSRVWWLFWFVIASYLPIASLTAKRGFLSLPLFGVLMFHLAWTTNERPPSRLKSAMVIGGTGVVMLMMFLALASIRNGIEGFEKNASEILRYAVGPYNTETLIVNEELSFPGEGKGYFWTHWVWTFPVATKILPLDELRKQVMGSRTAMGPQERRPLLNDEFGISASTCIPAFGCSFVDFGWFGAIPFFFVGALCAVFWRMFLAQQVTGLLFYPLVAYSFVQWSGDFVFPSMKSSVCLLVCLVTVVCLNVESSRSWKQS
jgi:oligosaccharide repeat unit polymerase